MNRVYPHLLTAVICIVVMLPQTGVAQCGCAHPDTLTQLVPIDTSNAAKSLITFNKYNDPTAKTYLACMTIQDTISVVSSTLARNQAVSGNNGVGFTVTVTAKITGPPNINAPSSNSISYGAYDFGPAGTTGIPSDSVLMGPDTILNKKVNTASPSNTAPYVGSGTISDTIQFGGGASSDAGTSFDYSIRTKYWGTARISFYICPAIVLATSIEDFTAAVNDNSIILQWITTNQQPNTQYEIQISTDSKNFYSIAKQEGNSSATGTSTKYQYQYNPDPTAVGKLYFRVKETDSDGKISYSTILLVDPTSSSNGLVTYRTFPNPATNSVFFQFSNGQTGRFLTELISTSGQVTHKKTVTLTGTSQIRLDLDPQPVKGLYFLRTTDLTRNRQYVTKVFIE
ncbi:MAG TPA: T9SS type A sorting domain-containing protein [Puia sp.]|nr:T9SS type A sorting domain-containing protein [Puia sp.]